ncbi:MAG: hypothetical protein WAM92_05420 [Mycobacterium sp.]
MGNRANFVVVKDQNWQLYYSHWAGCRMLDALIGGPAFALRYAQSLRPCAKDDWVDPSWADGGAVIDLDRRRLLFFGDSLMVEMPERHDARARRDLARLRDRLGVRRDAGASGLRRSTDAHA